MKTYEKMSCAIITGLCLLFCYLVFVTLVDIRERVLLEDVQPRPEFGTLPPACDEFSGVDWQHCMGVGPK